MMKQIIILQIFCITLAVNSMAAAYERVEDEKPSLYDLGASLYHRILGWTTPPEPPVEVPIFRPITRELTLYEQRTAAIQWEQGGFYLAGHYKGFPKNINKGLALINEAAQCGYASACYSLAGYFKKGTYGLPIDLGLAAAYERNVKWNDPGVPVGMTTKIADAPVATMEEDTSRRPSGSSDGSASTAASRASDSGGAAATGPGESLRRRHT